MSSTERLITAMHVVIPERFGTCAAWIERAQQHHGLLEAFKEVFGKRLPTPNKLGLWLSERCGQSAGELTLRGRHSLRRKGWSYGVWTKAALEPPAPPAPVAVQKPPVPESAAPADSVVQIAAPKPDDGTMLVAGPDGEPVRVPYTWSVGPNGAPIKKPGLPPPKRDYVLPTVSTPTDSAPIGCTPARNVPAWVAEKRQPTKAELIAQHDRTTGLTSGGFFDPDGVVSQNIARESGGPYMHVTGPWPGGRQYR